MPNISHFNVSDVAVYYQALVALTSAPTMATAVATEEIRRRSVTYLERRRAMFSLPPPRGQLETLGEKVLGDLRQMGLAIVEANKVQLTGAGLAIAENLKTGEGRRARLAILGKLVETYDNAAHLCLTLAPPSGRRLYLPIPRYSTEAIDDDDGETRLVPSNLESVCAAWTEWCEEQKRPDLLPADLQKRTETLLDASKDKRGFAEKARNALAQLVLEAATKGRIGKPALFRTIRDRLSSAGGLNSVTRPIAGKPLSVESVFACMHLGVPTVSPEEWQPLDAKLLHFEDIWIHEAAPAILEQSVLTSLRQARGDVVERAGYYRIYELRDRVCEGLGLSQGMFDSAFVHIYRTHPGLMTLGVDYEKITAKRLPIEIRDAGSSNLFNLVAFKGA